MRLEEAGRRGNMALRWALWALGAAAVLATSPLPAAQQRERGRTGQIRFATPLFGDGMILQRRPASARVWGTSDNLNDAISVYVLAGDARQTVLGNATVTINSSTGVWSAVLPPIAARNNSTLVAKDSHGNMAHLRDVAWGDVLLCGGQSNMGFGMCAARSKNQTAQQALDNVTAAHVRFLFYSSDAGSGPGGGTMPGICNTSSGQNSTTPGKRWFTANAANSGGASANCLLSAQYLAESLGPGVPVGAVESCEGGTTVMPWTPPDGPLFTRYILPLTPMAFKAVLWDQGENDVCCNAAHTNA
jgi:sialate O-acetylesterase